MKNNGFIPSYKKDKAENEDGKTKKLIDTKKIIILISVLLVVIIFIIFLTILLNKHEYDKYVKFENKIKIYGFDKVYDNSTCNTEENVTKSEAIKMVISAVYNTSNIEGFANIPEEEYSNAIWVEFAKKMGVITDVDVNKENADEYATYSDVIRFFTNAKSKILKLELNTEDKGDIKNINKYNIDERFGVLDMINNEVITIDIKNLNLKKKVFKGQLNEILSNFVEKYNTITLTGEKLNINQEKIPTNSEEYPYTVISVDKSVYEIEFSGKDNPNFKNPAQVFSEQKEYYSQIKNNTESYYNYLLNIDYNTITETKFKTDLRRYLLFDLDDKVVNEYVNYVKTNKIKLSGSAKVQIPILYFDGTYYRVRTKLEFKIESSNTNKNILYRDLTDNKTKIYDSKEYVLYIDTYMSNVFNNKTLYNAERTFYEMLIETANSNIKLVGE